MNLEEIVALFQAAHQRQIDVVRLHTGEPSIYGAIGEQMDALDRLQIAYEVVPGISAFQAAAAALQVELTAPDIAQTIILTRTPGRTPMPPSEDLSRLAQSRATLCIFLSTDRIAELTADAGGALRGRIVRRRWCSMPRGPTKRSFAARWATLASGSGAEGITRTAIFLVGFALARPTPRVSKLYDKTFGHGYRRGTSP